MDFRSPADLPSTRENVLASGNSRHYHYHHCIQARNIYERNVRYFDTARQAEAAGLKPCRVCSQTAASSINRRRSLF